MPLNPQASVWDNAKEMIQAGHPRDQAFAAAYRVSRDESSQAEARAQRPKRRKPRLQRPLPESVFRR
jgi:hypothetical protein